VGTVSRYLNNRAGVNEKTAERIAAAIRALDYTPAVVANR
jgi:DNA-binding LacI/PurR family transcriptional regulator